MMIKTVKQTSIAQEDVKKLAYLLAEHERLKNGERTAYKVRNQIDGIVGWIRIGEAWERKGRNNKEIIEMLNKMVVQTFETNKANVPSETWLETTVRDLYWKLVIGQCESPLNSENDQGWLDKIVGIVSLKLRSSGTHQEAKPYKNR